MGSKLLMNGRQRPYKEFGIPYPATNDEDKEKQRRYSERKRRGNAAMKRFIAKHQGLTK